MAIRAVDMQIMMPRMADLSVIHQAEKEKPIVEQLHMSNQQNKQVEHDRQVVRKTTKQNQMQNEADAKKKGKNSYTYHPGKGNSQSIKKEDEQSLVGRGQHLLDIKI